MGIISRFRSRVSRAYRRVDRRVFKGALPGGAIKKSDIGKVSETTPTTKQEVARVEQQVKRERTARTVKALATPVEQRTPEQLATTRKVGQFIGGVVVTAVPVAKGGQIAGVIGKRIAQTAIKRGVSTATVARTGTAIRTGAIGYGAVETGKGVKRIATGEATPFQAGATVGLGGALARPTGRIVKGAVRVAKPKIKPTKLPPTLTGIETKAELKQAGRTTQIFGGRFIQPIPKKKPIVTRFGGAVTEKYGTARGVIATEDKVLTPFISEPRKIFTTAGVRKIRFGFTGKSIIPGKKVSQRIATGRRKPFATEELYEFPERDLKVAQAVGEDAKGFIITKGLGKPRKLPDFRGSRVGVITKPKTKLETKQIETVSAELKRFRTGVKKKIKTGKIKTARAKSISEIKAETRILGTRAVAFAPTVTALRTARAVTTADKQRFAKVAKTATDFKLSEGFKTQQKVVPKFVTPPETAILPPPLPTTPFLFGFGFLPLGSAGRRRRRRARKGSKAMGRFTRSFTANVLGIKAPRKRKVKRRYTGFELRV